MPSITTGDGVNLHYTDSGGPGRPLVLVHGWPLSGEAFAGNVETFRAAGLRVIAYDRRGFGASDKPVAGYDYDTLAADLGEILDQLDLTGVVVLGFSMGGGEVARLFGSAASAMSRVAGVVFSGAITPALCLTDDNPDGAMPLGNFEAMAAACREDHAGFLDQFVGWFYSTENAGLLVSEEVRQQALRLALASDPEAAWRCILIWATDLRQDCLKVDVPALVIHGDGDINVPLDKSSARMAAFVADCRLEVIEGGPHGVNVTHSEQWEASILEFTRALG